ncbi:ATP-binding cassette domain-containing protein [Halomonas sp. KAO]|uniref:ATP-binding cassette domain-containing protein n=1 Tax=Halomonas sp. KAO TaxID=2783858 RepID=UPI0018A00E5F|nr:ATP-binding cassette domain-containing protein [Halomonas sp. KAO]MBF7051775.1 ATP-binding cassette domain-containing protein [Halomonas sp. KAO]
MIQISGLYKRYHRQRKVYDWVLEDINLTIPTGVSVGLLGRNGAGKSTLLKLIAGMDTPDRGEIHRHSRVSWPIGLSGGFQGSMSGRQNVKFVARVHGGRYNVDDIIDKVEAFAEIGDAFDEPIKTYSSGMRARLNFGLSLAFDFDVYLSDEATSVGDRAFKAKATKAFKDKVGQASIVMVSHSEGILKDLCQAGVYLKDGHATWYDDINDAIAAYHEETDAARKANGIAPEKPAATSKPKPTAAKPTAQGNQAEVEIPEGLTLPQARKQLREIKAEFDVAKAAFEQAKADELPPHERKPYGDEFRSARARLHKARRRVMQLQPPKNDGKPNS